MRRALSGQSYVAADPSAAVNREQVARRLTGAVAGGLGVTPDYENGAVPCGRCSQDVSEGGTLVAGDRVTALFRNYEGHTWEPVGVFCRDHGVERVRDVMAVLAEDQAVIAATLEPTGYLDPLSDHHPRALSFGGVDVLDWSPAEDGY